MVHSLGCWHGVSVPPTWIFPGSCLGYLATRQPAAQGASDPRVRQQQRCLGGHTPSPLPSSAGRTEPSCRSVEQSLQGHRAPGDWSPEVVLEAGYRRARPPGVPRTLASRIPHQQVASLSQICPGVQLPRSQQAKLATRPAAGLSSDV